MNENKLIAAILTVAVWTNKQKETWTQKNAWTQVIRDYEAILDELSSEPNTPKITKEGAKRIKDLSERL